MPHAPLCPVTPPLPPSHVALCQEAAVCAPPRRPDLGSPHQPGPSWARCLAPLPAGGSCSPPKGLQSGARASRARTKNSCSGGAQLLCSDCFHTNCPLPARLYFKNALMSADCAVIMACARPAPSQASAPTLLGPGPPTSHASPLGAGVAFPALHPLLLHWEIGRGTKRGTRERG